MAITETASASALGTTQTVVRSSIASLPGDVNLDGNVDIFDLATLQTKYGTTAGAVWSDGDFDANGTVDFFDLAILQGSYGSSVGGSSQAGTPGDANLDGTVDIFDVAVVQTKYGTTAGALWSDGDFDGNGTVDIFDVAALQTNYGHRDESALPLTGVKLATSYPYRIIAADSAYLITLSSTRAIGRLDAAGNAYSGFVFPVGYQVTRAVTTSTPGTVLFCVANLTTRKFAIYKSVDWGTHVGANAPYFDDDRSVLLLGDTDGTEAHQIQDVFVLSRGMREVALDGAKAILLVEYNVNAARVSGGVNDQVRLMKSVDGGTTWSKLASWNTDGVNHNVRHGHLVSQNPVTGEIYVGFGDTNGESGLIAWNGVSPWTSNQNAAGYASNPGFHAIAGAQRFRIDDILYEGDALIAMADAVGPSEAGIWRASHDLGEYRKVNDAINAHPSQVMWYGATLNGKYYAVTSLVDNCADRWVYLFASESPSTHWDIVGKFAYRPGTAGGLALNFFAWNGKLYLRQDHLVSQGTTDTLVLEPGVPFDPNGAPVILWPQ